MSSEEFSSEFERQRYLFYHVHNTDPFGHLKPYFGLPKPYEADRRDKTVIMTAKYALDKYNIAEGSCLELIRVVKASYTLSRGRWYTMILRASDCRFYNAVVYHRKAGKRDFFMYHRCARRVDGLTKGDDVFLGLFLRPPRALIDD
ncbi:hypothetical protein TIFTF001_042868 [Ficus carica]|uniref:Uncharacterized protein n=1 Tax=Ficus carica TaxID=3494 RepID=A0AA87YZV5_FICCA|nr:hypothetical protein TIFTF001_042868 [Ficus carica]